MFILHVLCVCSIKVIACVVCGSVKETAIKLTDIFMHNKATNIIKRFELFWHRFYDSSVFAFYFSSVVMKCERSPSFYSPSHKNPIQTDSEWWEREREKKTQSHKHIHKSERANYPIKCSFLCWFYCNSNFHEISINIRREVNMPN